MRKSARLRGLAVIAGLAAAAVAAVPGTAFATATSTRVITADVPNGFFVGSWDVGDCHLQARLTLGVDRVMLHATSFTRHTNHADVWHSTFNFLDVNGNSILHVGNGGDNPGPFDSPQMVPQGGQSSGPSDVFTWDRTLLLGRSIAPDAFKVQWQSAC